MAAEETRSEAGLGRVFAQASLDERLDILRIPEGEQTEAVKIALNVVFQQLDDMDQALNRAHSHVRELDKLVDVDCELPVPNREAFTRRLVWAQDMHERYHIPMSVLFFRLENVETLAETFGQRAYDKAFQHLAQCFQGQIRKSDYLGRVDEQHLAILFFHATYTGAQKRAEYLLSKLMRAPILLNREKHFITASYYIHELAKGDTPESVLSNIGKETQNREARELKADLTA